MHAVYRTWLLGGAIFFAIPAAFAMPTSGPISRVPAASGTVPAARINPFAPDQGSSPAPQTEKPLPLPPPPGPIPAPLSKIRQAPYPVGSINGLIIMETAQGAVVGRPTSKPKGQSALKRN